MKEHGLEMISYEDLVSERKERLKDYTENTKKLI